MKRNFRFVTRERPAATPQVKATNINAPPMDARNGTSTLPSANTTGPPILASLRLRLETVLSFIYPAPWWISTGEFKRSARGTLPSPLPIQSQSIRRNLPITDHHGIVVFSQRVKVPVGPSAPSSATRTTSREPSSTDSVPSYPLRFVLVKPE